MNEAERDRRFMAAALQQANLARELDEVPVGCVVVREGDIVAAAHDERERRADPTAHAELLAIRAAAEALGGWRLTECEVYVTLEPCLMCAGAIVLARIRRVVYGAPSEKSGAIKVLTAMFDSGRLNHRFAVEGGILETECAAVLSAYFQGKRLKKE